jgi:DNA-3-methyladenine glycosylase
VGDELTGPPAGPGEAGPAEQGDAGLGGPGEAGPGCAGPAGGGLLPRSFFDRPSEQVAPDLLGCVIEHQSAQGPVAVELTEVEAYQGASDAASHAYRGRTKRNAVMFGPPGHAYVYFTYCMHFCVNLVCLPAGTAEAVLLRAGRVVAGVPLARARRATARREADLARGPARLCQALAIDRAFDGMDVCDPGSPLRISGPGAGPAPGRVRRGPRVGVSGAAEVALRFWADGDPTVSVYRPHVPRRRGNPEPVTARAAGDGTMQR